MEKFESRKSRRVQKDRRFRKKLAKKIGKDALAVALVPTFLVAGALNTGAVDNVYYMVRSGDTLWSISRRYGLTVGELMKLNGLSSDLILENQRLLVQKNETSAPASAPTPTTSAPSGKSVIYTVVAGNTLWHISQTYHLSVDELKRMNGLTGDTIYIGQKLTVGYEADTSAPTATPTPSVPAAQTLYEQLKAVFPQSKMPTSVSSAGDAGVQFQASGDENNFSIHFTLNGQEIATYQKVLYTSADEAVQAVNQPQPSGQEVPLGYNIIGKSNNGAGSQYITWREGNWVLGVQGRIEEGSPAVVYAQKVVALLEQYFLPAPSNAGAIRMTVDGQSTLSWNENNAVYTVTHSAGVEGLLLAVSLQ
ncbi:MAG: LysM peptidoglycan-binding domain-containing protein [Lactobacillales bacterium]|jgi:LysM repeat protein|nr:LysM peptidoglycan-binding domain-containing protein [Lactobacillales bacterium]